ncbi:MAG: transaldolase [Microthrixaceae bacterium]
MGNIHDLFDVQGQSPWLDNLRRDWLESGEIANWIERGVRGITSNPSIFQKAIATGDSYSDQLKELTAAGRSTIDAYWDLVVTDIVDALELLRPVYDESNGGDGFVSVEVSPALALDTEGTIAQARELWKRIDRPNLFVKIPATAQGVPAIRKMIGEGCNINITLIFSLERHAEVMEAYIAGLEDAVASGVTDLSHIASVASFFISRVDTEVDNRLGEIDDPAAKELIGTAAVAQGQLAYKAFLETFQGERWEALAAKGAKVQRPLWASTSTKNPDFPDTLYVDSLIGPDSVNTLPEATLDAFEDHGTLARTVDADLPGAEKRWAAVGKFVDMDDVGQVLEDNGVAAFVKSFDELLHVLADRAASR